MGVGGEPADEPIGPPRADEEGCEPAQPACLVELERACCPSLSFSYANTTLLVQYEKPAIVLDYEKDKAKERRTLLEKAKEDGALDQGPLAQPGEPNPGGPGDCKQQ